MSKLPTILLTAIIALPLGAVAGGALRGHPNLEKARNSLNDADRYIEASQKANEGVWKDEGGHGQKAKEMIGQARAELDRAAEWVNKH
ncbi:MAG TPA: hypothetical protein VH165_13920 [Kofleriaceae bacterium]|jgi:hypothetical protein|nr:hypothetical protein [Kofleriaceae bacterium]